MVRGVWAPDEVSAGVGAGAVAVGDGPVAVPGGVRQVWAPQALVVSSVSGERAWSDLNYHSGIMLIIKQSSRVGWGRSATMRSKIGAVLVAALMVVGAAVPALGHDVRTDDGHESGSRHAASPELGTATAPDGRELAFRCQAAIPSDRRGAVYRWDFEVRDGDDWQSATQDDVDDDYLVYVAEHGWDAFDSAYSDVRYKTSYGPTFEVPRKCWVFHERRSDQLRHNRFYVVLLDGSRQSVQGGGIFWNEERGTHSAAAYGGHWERADVTSRRGAGGVWIYEATPVGS